MKKSVSLFLIGILASSMFGDSLPILAITNEESGREETVTSSSGAMTTTSSGFEKDTTASLNSFQSASVDNQTVSNHTLQSSSTETIDENKAQARSIQQSTGDSADSGITTSESLLTSTENSSDYEEVSSTENYLPPTEVVVDRMPHPEVQAMLDALTAEDLSNAVGADGKGVMPETASEESPKKRVMKVNLGPYANINSYIAAQNFPNPKIIRDARYNNLPQYYYKNYRPVGLVVHETANNTSTINGEVNYMYNNYYNAFVHAFTDQNQVIETAPTEYLAWGAGPNANPYFIHIELVRTHDLYSFAKSVNNDAYWIALQLYQWGLTPVLADNNAGKGSVISHHAVSEYLKGSNHTDPSGYFASWNYNMNQFFALIKTKYNAIKASDSKKATVTKRITFKNEMLVANNGYQLYTNPYNTPGATAKRKLSTIANNGDAIQVKEEVITSEGVKLYALENGLYVDQRALKPKATITKTEKINRVMSVDNLDYYLYNKPYNTLGASRQKQLATSYYEKQQVKVVARVTTSQNVKVYQLENGYYVDTKALGELATIKTQTNYSTPKNMYVSDVSYDFYSKPYNTLGMKKSGVLSSKTTLNTNVQSTSYVVTSEGVKTYYLKNIGWVDARAVKDVAVFSEDKTFKAHNMRIKSTGYNIYTAPYQTANWKLVTSLKNKYNVGNLVKATRYGTTNKGIKTYYIDKVGWVDYRALKEISTYKEVANFKTKKMRVRSTGYNIYSTPYHTKNWKLVANMKSKYSVNQFVTVTKYATTSDGVKTYYINKVGWVDSQALKNVATYKDAANFKAKTMKIKSNGYNIYSYPYNTLNAKVMSPLKNKYKNGTKVTVTRYGTTSEGIKTYYIKNVGWVDYRAL